MQSTEMKIYLVRHGKPEGTERGMRYLGITDAPLCGEGREMADAAGEKLAERITGGRIRIISSPLSRCQETAQIIAGHFGNIPVETEPDLHEIDMGTWDGRYFDEIRTEYPEEFEARGKDLWNFKAPGGESLAETGARVKPVIERLTGQDADVLIIVSHAGAIMSGLAVLTGIPFAEWRRNAIPYGGIFSAEMKDKKLTGITPLWQRKGQI